MKVQAESKARYTLLLLVDRNSHHELLLSALNPFGFSTGLVVFCFAVFQASAFRHLTEVGSIHRCQDLGQRFGFVACTMAFRLEHLGECSARELIRGSVASDSFVQVLVEH